MSKQCGCCDRTMPRNAYWFLNRAIDTETGGVISIPLCRSCMEAGRAYWCPRCETGYRANDEWSGWDDRQNGSVVVCREHSLSKRSPILLCDVADCKSRLRPSDRCTVRNRVYCDTHWTELSVSGQMCSASYCESFFHHGDEEAYREASDGRRFCNECVVEDLPDWFPVEHPYQWSYTTGCSCKTCRLLVGLSDRWPTEQGGAVRETGVCTECDDTIAVDDVIATSAGLRLCHTCSYGSVTRCIRCDEMRINEEFHLPFEPAELPQLDDSIPTEAPGMSQSGRNRWASLPSPGTLTTRRDGGLTYRQARTPVLRAPRRRRSSPPNARTAVCDTCIESLGTHWLCRAQCQMWFLNRLEACSCGGIHRYDYTPSELKFQIAEGQRARRDDPIIPFLGFELEIEAIQDGATREKGSKLLEAMASDWAYAVHDGTLLDRGTRGFEIVTHPFTYQWFEDHWTDIKDLLIALRAEGYRSWEGGRCGMHVHISRKPMSQAHAYRFNHFIYGSSNMAMCVGQRGYRDQTLRRYAPFDAENRAEFIKKVKKNYNPGVEGHYAALSATNPDTLEARWFRGTLQPNSFRKNIEFIHATWEFTRKFGNTSANEINFIGWLRGVPERRVYAVLLDYLERNYVTRR